MKTIAKITLAIGILCLFAFAQTEKPKAAVYIKGNPEGRDALRMAVNTFLIKSKKYQMIAVDAIDVVAKEQKRQMDGSVSNEDIALLGRDAGAQYVCVVERSESDGVSYVATSMVSVQSKIAELSEMSELPRGERIIDLIERQINTMLWISVPEPEPPPSPVEESYSEDSYTENSYTEPQYEDYYTPIEWENRDERNAWHWSGAFGVGLSAMMNSINSLYDPTGLQFLINFEFFKPSTNFRLGLNFDLGSLYISSVKEIVQKYPDLDSIYYGARFINMGAFVRLYPTNFIYLSGGASFGNYQGFGGKIVTGEFVKIIDGTRTVVFPVGVGFVLIDLFFIDAQYNVVMLRNGIGGYLSFNLGFKFTNKF